MNSEHNHLHRSAGASEPEQAVPEVPAATSGARILRAQIIEPGGPCNVYRVEPRSNELVLERVFHPASPRGVDLAQAPLLRDVPATGQGEIVGRPRWGFQKMPGLAEHGPQPLVAGPALYVLVLSNPPLAPASWVAVRLLGAFAASPSDDGAITQNTPAHPEDSVRMLARWIAVGIPVADTSLAELDSLEALPKLLLARLERALAGMMPDASLDASRALPRLSAVQIATLYREARAQVRQQQREPQYTVSESPHERLFAPRPDSVGGRFTTSLGSDETAPFGDAEGVSWQGLSGVGAAELRARGIAAFGEAEHLMRRVPTRFLRYLDELLPADERILFFANAETFHVRGWHGELATALTRGSERHRVQTNRWERAFGRIRTRTLQAGLLLVTERQVLLLRDLAPPDATLVQWGYTAQSWPLGRLVGVRALPAGTQLDTAALAGWPQRIREPLADPAPYDEVTAPPTVSRLALALEAASGIAVTGAMFPAEGAPALARAERLLADFVPWPGAAGAADQRVRAIPQVHLWRPTEEEGAALDSLGGMVPETLAQALTDATSRTLHPGETVLVQARTPDVGAHGEGKAALLTLTSTRLLIATLPTQAGMSSGVEANMRDLPLRAITSALLQHSVLGSGLVVYLTQAEQQPVTYRLSITFPSPLIVPFRALFTRLCALLQTPSTMEPGKPSIDR